MGEPACPAEHCLRVLQCNISFCCQALMDPFRQSSNPQKVACPNASCGRGECIADNINLLGARLHLHPALFVCWKQLTDLTDFPIGFNLQPESFLAESHNFLYGLFQVRFRCPHQEKIIYIPEKMLHVINPLPTTLFIKSLCDVTVKRRQINIGKPRACEIPDCQILCRIKQCFLHSR